MVRVGRFIQFDAQPFDAKQIRRRIFAEFSPMPAVKTSPSMPPRTAVSAPISLAARYTK
jgi:hypothetical protein